MKFRSGKRSRGDRLPPFLHSHSKQKKAVAKAGVIHLKSLGLPLISTSTGSPCDLIRLKPDRPSTIGRRNRCCEFFWADRRVSRQHCQIFFDSNDHKVFLWDGYIAPFSGFVLNENGRRLKLDESKGIECSRLRPSLNGVFVNRIRMTRGSAVELSAGDEVSFLCSNEGACNLEFRIGFTIERLFIAEEVVAVETKEAVHYWGQEVGAKLNIRILPFVSDGISLRSECDDCFYRASYLLGQCRKLLHGDKPTARSGEFTLSISKMINTYDCGLMDGFHGCVTSKNAKPLIEHGKLPLQSLCTNWNSKYKSTSLAQMHSVLVRSKNLAASEVNCVLLWFCVITTVFFKLIMDEVIDKKRKKKKNNVGNPFANLLPCDKLRLRYFLTCVRRVVLDLIVLCRASTVAILTCHLGRRFI